MAVAVVGWWATHVFMLVPATVVEGRGPFAGLRRSFGLVRGSRMRTFFVVVVTWFISVMPGVAAYALAGSAGDLFAANPAQTIGLVRFWVIQIVGLGFQSVTTPLMMACAMVLFTEPEGAQRRDGSRGGSPRDGGLSVTGAASFRRGGVADAR